MSALFLSSGLFLGWSLGANDASNVFGTAVGSQMIRFRTAALACSVFVILGAVISGAGSAHTLGKLGAVNAYAGAFMVALAGAMTVYLMTKLGYPVSTSQAIVGGIVGWNFFSGSLTDYGSLTKIALTWVACPVLAAIFAIVLYKLTALFLAKARLHMFTLDTFTRYGLLLVGCFGAYALGANNIANVMGVFLPVAPFSDVEIFGLVRLDATQQLFLLGGVAIAVGVFTYSKRVMTTVGEGIMRLSPVAALVVVTAHSLVLFIFSSQGLSDFSQSIGLPAIPLVPVSSSQAIVGAVMGIGLLRGGKGIRWRLLSGISSGWVVTPVLSALICYVCLFFLQNVFQQRTFHPVAYQLTHSAMERLELGNRLPECLESLADVRYPSALAMKAALEESCPDCGRGLLEEVEEAARLTPLAVTPQGLRQLAGSGLPPRLQKPFFDMAGRRFDHAWQLRRTLEEVSPEWRPKPGAPKMDSRLDERFNHVLNLFKDHSSGQDMP